MTVGLRIATFFCLCVGSALLALDAFGPAPLLALATPVPVNRTLVMMAGLFFCAAVSTAAGALRVSGRQTGSGLESPSE
jgi:hypothetical protein